MNATFVFADIAGFTALTEAHGDEEAAALVADFCSAVRAELLASGGAQVKTIGDALMLTVPDPGAAVLLGLQITHELMLGHGAPALRVGLHHGPAVERDGDYFGAAVNLAARVAAEEWRSILNALPAGWSTRRRRTSSAPLRAPPSSRVTPSASRAERRTKPAQPPLH